MLADLRADLLQQIGRAAFRHNQRKQHWGKWRRWKDFHLHCLLGISGLTVKDSSHIAQILAVLSNTNQQPIHGHLPHKKRSCKQIFPAFVARIASFIMQFSLCSVLV